MIYAVKKHFAFFFGRYTKAGMGEMKPIPVRLGDRLIGRLDSAAKRLGNNRAALIRFCLDSFLDHFEKMGGVASLPPNWRVLLQEQDGRNNVVSVKKSPGANISIDQSKKISIGSTERRVRETQKKEKEKIAAHVAAWKG